MTEKMTQRELLEEIRARVGVALLLQDPAHSHDMIREIGQLLAEADLEVNPAEYDHPRAAA